MKRLTKIFFILTGIVPMVFSSRLGWSCAVCFGEAGGNLSRGFYWGILLLLLLPITLIVTIGSAIYISVRKKAEQTSQ